MVDRHGSTRDSDRGGGGGDGPPDTDHGRRSDGDVSRGSSVPNRSDPPREVSTLIATAATARALRPAGAEILKDWAVEYYLKFRGPEIHVGRGFRRLPHIHVGPVAHIPLK